MGCHCLCYFYLIKIITKNNYRALTSNYVTNKPALVAAPPDLPDVAKCCIEKEVTHSECLEKLCDPKAAAKILVCLNNIHKVKILVNN